MTTGHPSTPFTGCAKVAVAFFVAGVLADAFGVLLSACLHGATAMAGLGASFFLVIAAGASVLAYVVGALVASGASHRWRGGGERRMALLCLGAIVVGPAAIFLTLAV